MHKFLYLLLGLSLFSACEKASLNSPSDSITRPVVQAFLQPGATPSVKITQQLPFGSSDTVVHTIDNLSVLIESNGQQFPLEFVDTGTYVGNFVPIAGQTYSLSFTYNGKIVTAQTVIPSKPTGLTTSATSIAIPPFTPGGGGFINIPDPINLSWNNPDNAYCLVVISNIDANSTSIFPVTNNNIPRRIFRSQPEQISGYEINARSFRYYGHHNVIVYRLNPEYASLYDNSGNSSQNLVSPFTNIVGGLGIFTGVNADTVHVYVHQ
ncbi:MAG: DUF4249 family protein [Bacteroidota bacterium]